MIDLVNLGRGTEWMADALCARVDPDLWFPERGQFSEPARRICARCPVLAPCRAFALDQDEPFGVWGGLTEQARHALAPRRPREDSRIERVRTLVAAGRSNNQIGAVLGCSATTVSRICRRVGIRSDRRPGHGGEAGAA